MAYNFCEEFVFCRNRIIDNGSSVNATMLNKHTKSRLTGTLKIVR